MRRWLAAAALCTMTTAHAAPPVALSAGEVKALLAPPAKGARIVALWALDCAYCEDNLTVLASYRKAHPGDVELVFVATDAMSQSGALEARLKTAKLGDVPSRAYTDATPDRIDYLIDPEWGGETPRTMAIHADGSRKAVSGMLTPERLATLVN